MNISEKKKEQRIQLNREIRMLTEEQIYSQSRLASKKVTATLEFKNANTILVYNAMRYECDPKYIISEAKKAGKRVVFPRCNPDWSLSLLIPNDDDSFVMSRYGILEPDEKRSAAVEQREIDLIIVPGLGFDRQCNRIGRGAGYYDRLLNDCMAYKIGFAFDCQIIDSVHTQDHDIKMDCVISASEQIVNN